jgi:hypothetical protein
MREQPHYSDLLTEEFFVTHYVEARMSYPKIRAMLLEQSIDISIGTLFKYAKKHGIGRTRSEAKRERDPDPLDYEISYMTEPTVEALDGFLLGDGCISTDSRSKTEVARLTCGLEHEGFCYHMMTPFHRYKPKTAQYRDQSMKSGFRWNGQTKTHPDFHKQYLRWYPDGGKKQPPEDVRITPKSVMMWYLGDGSLVQTGDAIVVRLSTDGFTPENVEFLAEKLREKGIACHRNNDNRIWIKAKGIPAFFDFIGRQSPIKCYDYKFDLPEWRFEAKRLREVADELGVQYNRLSHLVKTGRLGCYRASAKGRPRMMPEHIESAKKLIMAGDLY